MAKPPPVETAWDVPDVPNGAPESLPGEDGFCKRSGKLLNGSLMSLPGMSPAHCAKHQASSHLMDSCKSLGDATEILPVVSALVFVLSVTELLSLARGDDNRAPSVMTAWHKAVMLLLAFAACLSGFTTTFALLEFYYIRMSCGADRELHYNHIQRLGVDDEERVFERQEFVSLVFKALDTFKLLRRLARNSMWAAMMCMLLATALYILSAAEGSWATVAAASVLVLGILAMLGTVLWFRSVYRPLLEQYQRKSL
eukprot:TRINITY_DN18540_c0_g2_i1.p1 TRINITY_DN18540_c0_g2~~TRINITY_DN18540_c0_g2_i1.p1  ORF type:complete len:272 (-),score=42.59 TRINITY_DN18540_c0_g2_i1:121-885(-)